MRLLNRTSTLLLALLVSAVQAQGAPIDMDVTLPTIEEGTSNGTLDLDVTLSAVVIDAPDAYVKIQLWGLDRTGEWYRVRPISEQSTLSGQVMPASPGDWYEFRGIWFWPAAGNVRRIVYERTESTAIYIAGARAAKQ